MTKLIKDKERFTIETCDTCGAEFYNVMDRCSFCGNMMLTSEKYDEITWRNKKRIIIKARVKASLKPKQNEAQAANRE